MAIRVNCEECGTSFKVGNDSAGKTGWCPECDAQLVVPSPDLAGALASVGSPDADQRRMNVRQNSRPSPNAPQAAMPPAVPPSVPPGTQAPPPVAGPHHAQQLRPRGRAPVEPGLVHPGGLALAALAAALGAVIWAGLTYATGYEIGYVAWGVGFLVGMGAVIPGGRGVTMGVLAAALTIGSIFGGKLVAAELIIENEIESFREVFDRATYDEMRVDAADFAELPDLDDPTVREFMVTHAYTAAARPQHVDPQELADFHEYSVPSLQSFQLEQPSFETWQEVSFDEFSAMTRAEITPLVAVQESAGPIDLLFIALGIFTAFGICNRD